MVIPSRPKIVVLGMMSHMPIAGNIWLVLHYLLGFQRLGFDVYYVEEHGLNPSMLMRHENDDSAAQAAAFLHHILNRFDLGDRWAYHSLAGSGSYQGMSQGELRRLYASAALVINLHGGTVPLAEHTAGGPFIYLGTDPGQVELELYDNDPKAVEFLAPHAAFFTWG